MVFVDFIIGVVDMMYFVTGLLIGIIEFIIIGVNTRDDDFFDSLDFSLALGLFFVSIPLWPISLLIQFLIGVVNILNKLLNKHAMKHAEGIATKGKGSDLEVKKGN